MPDGVDGGADDNFLLMKNSPAIDAGSTYGGVGHDKNHQLPVDDPGVANTGETGG